MMTNSYLIRATLIRDKALADADRREQLATAGVIPVGTRIRTVCSGWFMRARSARRRTTLESRSRISLQTDRLPIA